MKKVANKLMIWFLKVIYTQVYISLWPNTIHWYIVSLQKQNNSEKMADYISLDFMSNAFHYIQILWKFIMYAWIITLNNQTNSNLLFLVNKSLLCVNSMVYFLNNLIIFYFYFQNNLNEFRIASMILSL